jgi:hypothetical protein
VHLDAPGVLVPEGSVVEGVRIDVAAEHPLQVHEHVAVEGGGDARGVVVGRLEPRAILAPVDADEEARTGAERVPGPGEEAGRRGPVEVADAAAREEAGDGGALEPPGQRQRPRVVGADGVDRQVRMVPGQAARRLEEVVPGDVEGHVGGGIEAVEEQPDLARGAAAVLDEHRAAAEGRADRLQVLAEDPDLRVRRVVLGQLGDALEERRTPLVVEELRRQRQRPRAEAGADLLGDVRELRLQVVEGDGAGVAAARVAGDGRGSALMVSGQGALL